MGASMIGRDSRIWRLAGVGLGLVLLAACSGEKRAAPPPPAAKAAAPLAPATPARPEGADAVDAAVVEMQLFSAAAGESLLDIAATETAIRTVTAKALDAARRIEAVAPAQRPALARTYASAMADREAARAKLVASLDAFRTTSDATLATVEATAPACAGALPAPPTVVAPASATALAAPPAPVTAPPFDGTLATYPGCGVLLRDQADMAKTIANLSKAFESAEATYRADRRRLDEAAATMALVQ